MYFRNGTCDINHTNQWSDKKNHDKIISRSKRKAVDGLPRTETQKTIATVDLFGSFVRGKIPNRPDNPEWHGTVPRTVYSVYWMASTEAAHVMTESWMFESTLRTMDPPLTCSLDIDHERIEHRYKLSLGWWVAD
jgi:hypothetical protein